MSMLNMISFIQYSTVFYKQKNKEWKRNKIINIGNEKENSFFAYVITVYIQAI